MVLVPEISLTAQTVGRFRSRFGEQVAVLHSKLSLGERFDQWDLIRQGRARVVVGARSTPCLRPFKTLDCTSLTRNTRLHTSKIRSHAITQEK